MDKRSVRFVSILLFMLTGIFIVDQNIKSIFVEGWRYYGACIDLILVYNKGVAFSMLAFLDEWLKYIQLAVVFAIFGYMLSLRKVCYAFPVGMLLGGALSNIYDRFVHGGVVDMVYWHCGFDFAVFNFADVIIDIAVIWILILHFKPKFCKDRDES